MTIWLGGRAIAGTVAGIASAGTAGIMHPGAADEGRGGMTEMAIQSGRNVAGMLSGCRYPMAGIAIIDDAGMIKHRTDKGIGVMTDATILIG